MTHVGEAKRDCQMTRSRRFSMIVPQKSSQPIVTSHRFVAACVRDLPEEQYVVLTLMISLSVVMRHIVFHRPSHGSFAKGNDLGEALVFNRPYPALGVGRQRQSFDVS
jgi:hypothetical protein